MKTAEELKAIKAELKALNAKLADLTEEELEQVTGGYMRNQDKTREWVGGNGTVAGVAPKDRDVANS